jgi:tetratricopeptide (TPR) repeat protein
MNGSETGKNTLVMAKQFVMLYKAPLAVAGIILTATLIDYRFRASDTDWYAKGLASMSGQKWDAAISDFSRALRQNPADPASRFGLGWAYHSKGWLDEAIKQYEMAGKNASDSGSSSYFNMGVIYQSRHELDEAITAYTKALALNPGSASAAYNLGFVYLDKNMTEPAVQQFKRAMQLDPKNLNAIYYAGYASEKLGRRDEAKRLYQSVLSIDAGYHWASDRLKGLQ